MWLKAKSVQNAHLGFFAASKLSATGESGIIKQYAVVRLGKV